VIEPAKAATGTKPVFDAPPGAVGFFQPGPWCGVDPFGPFKRVELDDPSVDADLAALDELASLDPAEHAAALVQASLWGNRADLGSASLRREFRLGA
jgi:hypothetical protein